MLKANNLRKTFSPGTVNEKFALNGVSLQLAERDFITVIGGNGAGKSTLLNAIAGVFPIDSGDIFIDSKDVTKYPEHKRSQFIGRVFQDPIMGTASSMTIEENLAMAHRRGKPRGLGWGITNDERALFIDHLKILGLGLENRLTSKTGLLSGGQRQALTLLMATILKPRLLLLDEHTAALDPKTAQTVLDLTERIISENQLTVIMVTHNMKDALKTGNRIAMMHEGDIILDIGSDEKKSLHVSDLLEMFEKASGDQISSDRMLLS
ncbi:MAG: ABC transporter ATP-binding protein [Clostridiales bacterium]|jgi:putative ABC transport system ATP-binding protein|nr:ABC transporter ATP-binding protein [Clostridiales bacterium]